MDRNRREEQGEERHRQLPGERENRNGLGRRREHGRMEGVREDGRGGDRGAEGRREDRRRGDARRGERGVREEDMGGRRREDGNDDRYQPRKTRPWKTRLGFRRLTELQEKDPSAILITIAHSESGLQEGLNDATLSKDFIKLFLRCIAKSCECQSAPAKLIQMLTLLHNSTFINTTLPTFIISMLTERSHGKQREFKQPLRDVVRIVSEIARRSPSSITSVFGVIGMLETVMNVLRASSTIIDDELWEEFENCCELKEKMLKEVQTRSQTKEKMSARHDDDEPPNDFREISVFPEKSDIKTDELPFLRRNLKEGSFRDLHHYLDVQFRLLREDFIGPLRDGINEYIAATQQGKSKRSQDMRIYFDVQIICPIGTNNGLCHRISFNVSRLQRVNWESSKRLIFGSLVCLSSDNFKTLLFATVAERDAKKLKEGVLDVKFEGISKRQLDLDSNKRYVMAETVAYFEAYRHVLKGLQNVNEGDLPFERYIIQCRTKSQPPLYLRQNPSAKFDLRPLIDEKVILKNVQKTRDSSLHLTQEFSERSAVARKVDPNGSWPGAELLHLDESQHKAVRRALTNEFVLTQGPPGTGKTYIGLKIVKALLHNYKLWNTNPETQEIDHRPMLVVCYTNHALDQFLDGISLFFKGAILRVGGRSTSEIMKKFNLHNMRARLRELREVPVDIHRGRVDARMKMKDHQDEINRISSNLEIASREVLNESVLEPFMGRFYADLAVQQFSYFDEGFKPRRRNKHSIILDWLSIADLAVEEDERDGRQGQQQDLPFGNAQRQVPVNDVNNPEVDEAGQAEVDNADNEAGDELVDVVDEMDAMLAQREIGEDFDDENDQELQRAELMMLKMSLNKQSTVALNVTSLDDNDEKQQNDWQMTRKQKKQLKKRLRKELSSSDRMDKDEIERIYDIWALTQRDRWRLYRYWVHKFSDMMREKIRGKIQDYQYSCDQYREILMQEDKGIMRQAIVVGMTTTGAAKYQSVLQEIGPRIIVVEEAAEVLEAHVITTLSRNCQQLILIGDHQQLRPNPTVYKLAKEYNLDLSLFERMLKNDIDLDCLGLQHRMRPEISRIMTLIYPDLEDHSIVTTYERVRGVSTNIFFINHSEPESSDEDLKSHSNMHEAFYIARLCRYFILQGYKPEQITILTLYSGQLFTIRKEMPKSIFNGVRITVVDNFQGEENDIILLSLVRSNSDGKIGFLKIDNRVCVALSRAKKGLFVIGNMDMMVDGSKLWRNIVTHARKENIIGNGLHLVCENHPDDTGTVAVRPEDFRKVPEGGCMKPCQFRLECGHTCSMVCHILDQKHEKVECRKPCERKLCERGHKCTKLCYQKCGNCYIKVPKKIPKCGHTQMVPCHLDPAFYMCRADCTEILPCGHSCKEMCGEEHTSECLELVPKSWSCGHKGEVPCFERTTAVCVVPCQDILDCEHICAGSCGTCFMGRLHGACKAPCQRTLICGHICADRCSRCPPCQKPCENRCKHSECKNRCGEPCVPCNEKCEWSCRHHECRKLCCEPCERPRCDRPCTKRLACKHKCIGMCGEKCPRLCRVCDNEVVTEIFFGDEDEPNARFIELEDCGHIFEVNAMDTYMDQSPAEEENEILFKGCPKCKTPIRKNLRYGNQIKKTLKNIEEVKRKVLGNTDRITGLLHDIPDTISELQPSEAAMLRDKYNDILEEKDLVKNRRMNKAGINKLWEESLITIENQGRFLKRVTDLKKKYRDDFHVQSPEFKEIIDTAKKQLEDVTSWILKDRTYFTPQETSDLSDEILRLTNLKNLFLYKQKIRSLSLKLEENTQRRMRVAERMLTDGKKFSEPNQKKVKKVLEDLKDVVPRSGLGISEEERIKIVEAMGMEKGHWFKCRNGHIYAIGDCGGATMESKCPECGATIGGRSHTLRQDNQFAPEMDRAQGPAWPTALHYNLENYRL